MAAGGDGDDGDQGGGGQPGAGGAVGLAEGDGAAVRVHPFRIQARLGAVGEDLCGERFVAGEGVDGPRGSDRPG